MDWDIKISSNKYSNRDDAVTQHHTNILQYVGMMQFEMRTISFGA